MTLVSMNQRLKYFSDVLGVKYLPTSVFQEMGRREEKTAMAMEQEQTVKSKPLSLFSTASAEVAEQASSLEALSKKIEGCVRCKLHQGRQNIVFGAGSLTARLMFVGEGPGEQEDIQGLPFVGMAGQLLTKMVGAMGLTRDQVYIANVVKCRPPNNRNPQPDEISSCSPFLIRQINLIKPQVIVALGTFAAQTLLQTEERISRLRGRVLDFQNCKFIATFHPAYLLRNPGQKKLVWEDLQLAMAELGLRLGN